MNATLRYFFRTLGQAARLWYDRGADSLAATASYYMIFAVTPFLLLVVTFMGTFYGTPAVVRALSDWGKVLGPDMLHLLTVSLINLEARASGYITPLIGALFFSSVVIVLFNTFTNGFYTLWNIQYGGFTAWYKKSLRSVLFTVVTIIYLALLMIMNLVIGFTERWLSGSVVTVLSFVAFLVLTTTLFMIAFGLLPVVSPNVRARFVGGFIASVLLFFVKSFVTVYLFFTPTPGLFGTAGLILVFLIWSYASAAVVYYGAALAYVRDPLLPFDQFGV